VTSDTDFGESGFWMTGGDGWRLVVSRRLGGALCVQWRDGRQCYDLGYEARLANGRRVSSAHWQGGALNDAAGDRVTITQAPFEPASDSLPLVRWMVPFQIVTSALVSGWAAERFQRAAKARMVRPKGEVPLTLRRTVALGEAHELSIEDEVRSETRGRMVVALGPAHDVPFYSPSARQEPVVPLRPTSWDEAAAAAALNAEGVWRRRQCYRIDADGLRLTADSA